MAHLRRRSSFINKAQDIILFQDNFDGIVLNPNSDYTIVDADSVFSQNDELIQAYNNGSGITLKSIVSYNLSETGTLTFAWKINANQGASTNNAFLGLMSDDLDSRRVAMFYQFVGTPSIGWQTKITSVQNEQITFDFETSPQRMRITLQSNAQKLEYWNGSSWIQLGTARTQIEGGNDWHIALRANNIATHTDILDDFILTNAVYATELPYTTSNDVDVYIMDGQSNNKGKGEVSELPARLQGPLLNQYIWHENDFEILEDGQNQVGYALTSAGGFDYSEFGAEMEFAYQRKQENKTSYIVKVGRGGTYLAQKAGDDHSELSSNELHDRMLSLVSDAITNLQNAGKTPIIKAYFWMQGEWDGLNTTDADNYEINLTNKIAAVRSDLSLPNLPVIIGRLSVNQTGVPERSTIRTAQDNVNTDVDNTSLIDTDSYTMLDTLHFDTDGQISLGLALYNNI